MEIKPDDYYNNGTVEMARFGRHTLLKNNMSHEQHKKMMKKLKRKYPVLKEMVEVDIVLRDDINVAIIECKSGPIWFEEAFDDAAVKNAVKKHTNPCIK